MECDTQMCQVCQFIFEISDCAIRSVTVTDILSGKHPMPFTSRASWKKSQQDCPSQRRVFAHLSQGMRPTKKNTKIKDIKRYICVVILGRDGLLIVKQTTPFNRCSELTVIPQGVVSGLLTALHLRLHHPSKSQLMKVFHRYFYALDSDHIIQSVTSQCSQCAALAKLPPEVMEYTISQDKISGPGTHFAFDVMCCAKQKICVL